jgi:hypothetical protein
MNRKKGGGSGAARRTFPALTGLSSLLAAPLAGLAEADFMTALAAVHLMEAHGFERDGEGPAGEGHLGSPRTVSFFCPPGGAGEGERNLVRIPLLSLLPLPLLQIADAEVEMGVRLVRPSAPGEEADGGSGAGWQAMLAPRPRPGRWARERDALFGANLTVKVRVRQADLPAGTATLLQVLGQSASSVPYSREAPR